MIRIKYSMVVPGIYKTDPIHVPNDILEGHVFTDSMRVSVTSLTTGKILFEGKAGSYEMAQKKIKDWVEAAGKRFIKEIRTNKVTMK